MPILLGNKYGKEQAWAMEQFRRMIWDAADYVPTRAQAEWLFDGRLTKLVSGGVRSGKSFSTARAFDWWCCLPDSLIWIVGPDYAQARAEFLYWYAPYKSLGLVEKESMPAEGSLMAKIAGGPEVRTRSSDDLRKLASFATDVFLVVEAGQQHWEVLDKAFERGLEKDAYIILSGTFENANNWYADTFENWQGPKDATSPRSYSLPTWTNTVSFPGGRDDPKFARLIENMEEEKFNERVAAVPYKPQGLVFREFDTTTHVAPLPVDPTLPVYIAMDPAYHAFALLFIQTVGEYVHVLDEIYAHNAVVQDVIPQFNAHPLRKYVTTGVADIASKQRHGNESVYQVWRRETGMTLVANHVKIAEGIRAVKLRLQPGEDGLPRLMVNSAMKFRKSPGGKASSLRAEFALYKWPDWSQGKNVPVTPIDANNDALKALGYFLFWRYRADVVRPAGPKTTYRSFWQ